jgi:hypothetical protein
MRRQLRFSLFVAMILVHPLSPTRATGQAEAIYSTTAAVDQIITDLQRSLSELISEAEGAYSRQAFDSRVHAQILLTNLSVLAGDLINKTFGELSNAEKQLVVDIDRTLDKWNEGNHNLARDFARIASTLEQAVSRLPLADRTPLVTSYTPGHFIVGTAAIRISVFGGRLGFGEPSLVFGSTKCRRVAKTEASLTFECPGNPPNTASGTSTPGRLVVHGRRSVWSYLTFDKRERVYDIDLIAIPVVLGTYGVRAVVRNSQREERTRGDTTGYRNGHCEGSKDKVWTYNAGTGWRIDEPSVVVVRRAVSKQSTPATARSISETGFQVYARVRNNGHCTRVFGKIVAKDARGTSNFAASWTEYRTVTSNGTVNVGVGDLSWKKAHEVVLPDSAIGFVLTVKRQDGSMSIHTTAGPADWYSIDYSPSTRSLVIRPREVASVLGN